MTGAVKTLAARIGKLAAAGGAIGAVLAVAGCGSGTAGKALPGAASLTAAQSRGSLRCAARVTSRHPVVGSSVGIQVRTARRARVKVDAYYRRVTRPESARAGTRGRHVFWYGTAGAASGFRVRVVVHVSRRHHRGVCSAWFTPQRGTPVPDPTATPIGSASPTPSPTKTAAPTSSPSQSPTAPAGGAWCSARVTSFQDSDHDEWLNNVYVHSNQPHTDAHASGGSYSWSYETDGTGYAEIYLNGPPPGTLITVTVGGATCTTSD
jgi:hypothetical protein